MPGQSSDIKKVLLWKSLIHPNTLIPFIASIGLLGYNLSQTEPSIGLNFLALCSGLASIGMALTRWFNLDESDVDQAINQLEENQKQEIKSELSQLKKDMLKDRDTRTDLYANHLYELYHSFNMDEVKNALPTSIFKQLEPQIEALFENGVKKLRESAILREKAESMDGKAADRYEKQRKEVLLEVKQHLITLESSLQDLLSHNTEPDREAVVESDNLRMQFEKNLQRAMELDTQMNQMIDEDPSRDLRDRYLSNKPKNKE